MQNKPNWSMQLVRSRFGNLYVAVQKHLLPSVHIIFVPVIRILLESFLFPSKQATLLSGVSAEADKSTLSDLWQKTCRSQSKVARYLALLQKYPFAFQ